MSEEQQKKSNGRLSTPSWVALIVGITTFAAGIVFDIDARSVADNYKALAVVQSQQQAAITGLLQTAVTNATNIANLTAMIREVKTMVENHVIGDARR